jgi:hypothetical protein
MGGKDFSFWGQMGIFALKSLKLGATVIAKPFEILWSVIKKVFGLVGDLFGLIAEGWKNIGSWVGPLLEKLLGVQEGSFDLSGFGKSILNDLNKNIDEAQATLSETEPIEQKLQVVQTDVAESVAQAPKSKKIKESKQQVKVADKEKIKRQKEEKKKEEEKKNKELAEAIGNAVGKKLGNNGPQEMILKNIKGEYIGNVLVKNSRGG